MTTCSTNVCGTGDWSGPLPGDPDNNSVLSATAAFGGIDVSWTYPTTNPNAVAHTLLYRGISSNFSTAILLAVVAGNSFYDKSVLSIPPRYYYWIRIVSVNGTEGELIGPASAIASGTIAQVIAGLTGSIDASHLAQSLKTDIDRITLTEADLATEISDRLLANAAFSAAVASVQSGLEESFALLDQEVTLRQDGDSALVSQVNVIAAGNATNTAAILTEQAARVSGDSAVASSVTQLSSQINNATTGLPATRALLLTDYYTKATTDSAISSAVTSLGSQINSTLTGYTNTATLSQNFYTKTQTDSAISSATTTFMSTTAVNAAISSALTPYTTTASLQTNYYTKTGTDGAISSAITTSQATLNGNITSAQTTLQTNINTVDGKITGIGALYTAKVTVDGLIGGFGVYNNGTTVDAGFDVDTFWVGRTQANKRKPFIISGGVTYIDDAAIEKLTFSKLRDSSGSFIVENGKVKADYLNVTRVTGGSFTQYNWPSSGNGFYLGPEGLLLGNPTGGGQYFQVENNGNIFTRGFSVIGGNAVFSGTLTANTVTTTSMASNAVTQNYTSSTSGASTSVTISVPDGTSSVVILVGIGSGIFVGTGSGESSAQLYYPPVGKLLINGTTVVAEASSAIVWSVNSPGAGTYTITSQRTQYSENMYLVVMVNKR